VLEYCRLRLLWSDLLAEMAKEYPAQVARFERDLRGPV
jgi:hypothetical protein